MSAQIWLISDTHFGHANILRFTGADGQLIRPGFGSVDEMDAYMVDMWNQTVKPQDHVYHLGDFTMRRGMIRQYGKLLNGHKRLVLGNHDDPEKIHHYRDAGFKKICGTKQLFNVLISHYPIHNASIPSRCAGNVHGHIHEKPSPSPRHFNVSVERIGYTPISYEDVVANLRKAQNECLDQSKP